MNWHRRIGTALLLVGVVFCVDSLPLEGQGKKGKKEGGGDSLAIMNNALGKLAEVEKMLFHVGEQETAKQSLDPVVVTQLLTVIKTTSVSRQGLFNAVKAEEARRAAKGNGKDNKGKKKG